MGLKTKLGRILVRVLPGSAVAQLMRSGAIGPEVFPFAIRENARQLSNIMSAAQLKQGLTVKDDGSLFVVSDGISLNAVGTNRYLKVANKPSGNQGEDMASFLEYVGVSPRNVFDLGANFGEISLYFAKFYPQSRVVAVEASSENLAILQSNLKGQGFSTSSIQVIHAAMSDRDGTVRIGRGKGADNSILPEYQNTGPDNLPVTEDVAAISLQTLFSKSGVETVDFMKIDIEGAEPLLLDAICELSGRIQAMLIEFGSKNTAAKYMPFLHRLTAAGFSVYAEGSKTPFADAAHAEAHHLATREKGVGEDFWFIRKSA